MADANTATVIVSGPTATVDVWSASNGPDLNTATITTNAQRAEVRTRGPSGTMAEMGYFPNATPAFRAYDSVDPVNPAWSVP
jgi:hypothetical protein